jgi:hypothetical protein
MARWTAPPQLWTRWMAVRQTVVVREQRLPEIEKKRSNEL